MRSLRFSFITSRSIFCRRYPHTRPPELVTSRFLDQFFVQFPYLHSLLAHQREEFFFKRRFGGCVRQTPQKAIEIRSAILQEVGDRVEISSEILFPARRYRGCYFG